MLSLCALAAGVVLAAPPPPGVIVQEAHTDQIADRVEALGTLKANESVTLTATITDTISAIHFEDGQRVEAGDVLVELTSGQERAGLAEARSVMDEAKRQFERVKPLVETGAVSGAAYDQRQREYQTARARYDALRSQLGDHVISAPFAGVVGLRNVSVGALVRPGDVLTTLDDDSVMKLDFSVPETRLPLVQEGIEVQARTRAVPDHDFAGTVRSIDSRVDPVTRSVVVRAILPNPDHLLRPGQLMTVVLLGKPRQALVVREEAIVSEGHKHFVFVVEDEGEQKIAEQREVTLGTRRPGEVEILKGLSPGERIITHGTIRVHPGSPVRIRAVQKGDESLETLLHGGDEKVETP